MLKRVDTPLDNIDRIIAYESGELTALDEIQLFSDLIKDGSAWTLQGHYGRTAMYWIEMGIINRDGTVNQAAQRKLFE
jgi:hypothetical protein